jgi:hypothetical protein
MEPGKMQYVTWLLLGFFTFRVAILRLAKRYSRNEVVKRLDWETSGGEREALRGADRVPEGNNKLM